jgi:hypothetical protein
LEKSCNTNLDVGVHLFGKEHLFPPFIFVLFELLPTVEPLAKICKIGLDFYFQRVYIVSSNLSIPTQEILHKNATNSNAVGGA